MKTEELRIGNYITIDNMESWADLKGVPMIVTAIDANLNQYDEIDFPDSTGKFKLKNGQEEYGQFSEFVKPIKLTDEWLLKFGFVRKGYTSGNGSKLVLHHPEEMYKKGRVYFNSWAILEMIPEYVHQLQNLYFALIGEELTIK